MAAYQAIRFDVFGQTFKEILAAPPKATPPVIRG